MKSEKKPNAAVPPIEPVGRILVAEDHDSARSALENLLAWKGFEVTTVADGRAALEILTSEDGPSIALLDWEMPGMSGVEICRELRGAPKDRYVYLIVFTAREGEEDITAAMAAGADDFIRKPFGVPEVVARIRNGQRILRLERGLEARIAELKQAQEAGGQSQLLLPICTYCKKIRGDSGIWLDVESYIHERTGVEFTHGACDACMEKIKAAEMGVSSSAKTAKAKSVKLRAVSKEEVRSNTVS